jgi:hypothetical protein
MKNGTDAKKRLKIESKCVWKTENFFEGNDFILFIFSKGDQHLPKMGQTRFLIRWCKLIGLSCVGESFILRNQIWKNGLSSGFTKNRTKSKKFKYRA